MSLWYTQQKIDKKINELELFMKKRMAFMILFLLVVFGGVFGWDAVRSYFMGQYFAHYQPPPVTISTVKAKKEQWDTTLVSVGTLVAVNGVTLSPQVAGIVTQINFKSGEVVKKGQLLIKLDDRTEQAELENSEAALVLAKLEFERNQNLLKQNATSRSAFDKAKATMQQDQAMVDKMEALIAQKNIVAPFDGRLGIREINLGQYLSAGTAMVTLQALDPIFINFYLPEQNLQKIFVGQIVRAEVDTAPGKLFEGTISAINSEVDIKTHNVLVQATFENKDEKLYPGLFANIHVIEPEKQNVVVLPNTAITYSLFGDSVYILEKPEKPEKNKEGKEIYTVKQVFVKTGEQTGDTITILSGVKAGQEVVASGQLKLSNDTRVIVDNSVKLDQKQNEIY
jgi:membrane fusion protein (multidrug efflux system)